MKQLKIAASLIAGITSTTEKLISILPTGLLLKIASLLARSRSLGLYPGWHFAVGWHNPRGIAKLRKAIWKQCNRRKSQRAIVMKWYDGLRINAYLGNDMSRCLFIDGCIEPNEFAFFENVIMPGMVFIDGGANEGLYTLFASHRVGLTGKVLAIEPSRREFHRLQANLQLNQVANVQPLQFALSNRNGSAALCIAGYEHEGQNTLGEFVHIGIECSHTEQVILKRLDDLVNEMGLKQVDVIKLDVEGAEYSVLDGAMDILTTFQPLLLLELSDEALQRQGSSATRVVTLLNSLGYNIYTFDKVSGKPVKVVEDLDFSKNIIAAHSDRMWKDLNDDK